ncbi:uncharacterized protein [Procambarus clarkii]|uniref:uncharacterized protein n=1 Tax=Procambarus clarkii TaxID=6728 RepID=UPI001E670FE8|nr:uncharacterized protein LOC123771443 [Procambarus clarkii]
MHLLMVLLLTSVAQGLEPHKRPLDCEVRRLSDGWTELLLHDTLLISFFNITSVCEINLTIISQTSGNCIFTDWWFKGLLRSNLTCEGLTFPVINRAKNVIWRDIFVDTTSGGHNALEIMLSDSMNSVQTVQRILQSPFFVNLSISGGADIVLNCPNAGCLKAHHKLFPKTESRFSSFFVYPGVNFDGIEITTEPRSYTTILPSSHFSQSVWSQVYVTYSQSLLKVRVNGRLAQKKLVSGSSFSIRGFRVLGDGEIKWCESDEPVGVLGEPLIALAWCLTSVELLLLFLTIAFVCVYRRKLISVIRHREGASVWRSRGKTPAESSVTVRKRRSFKRSITFKHSLY